MKAVGYLLASIVFFLLALFQNSFLPYFSILGQTPNLVLIAFVLLVFFEKPDQYLQGFFLVILAGFLLDVFLPYIFGISIAVLLMIYFLIKLTSYFFQKSQTTYIVLYFLVIFSLGFILHEAVFFLFSKILNFPFNIHLSLVIKLIYNLVFATFGFYLYRAISESNHNNQLKLF